MTRLQQYTDQQSRMARSFSRGGGCCQVTCEACERTYFVTSAGHGDYSEGELEGLLLRAHENPDEYIEVDDFGSVSTMIHPGTGKSVVVGCLCDPTKNLSEFIERHAEELKDYLTLYFRDIHTAASAMVEESAKALASLGWSEMSVAPKTTERIEVELKDGSIVEAHWASDLSGEEQPPFQGWFVERGDGFSQVFPIHWRKVKPNGSGKSS